MTTDFYVFFTTGEVGISFARRLVDGGGVVGAGVERADGGVAPVKEGAGLFGEGAEERVESGEWRVESGQVRGGVQRVFGSPVARAGHPPRTLDSRTRGLVDWNALRAGRLVIGKLVDWWRHWGSSHWLPRRRR